MKKLSNRREFLKQSSFATLAAGFSSRTLSAAETKVPTRLLGKTGESISILGLGGWHAIVSKEAMEAVFAGKRGVQMIRDEKESIRFIRQAIDSGVTFLDNAWEYHDGLSEQVMGKALKDGYRDKSFLMTKHHGRDKKTALKQLHDSLRRLGTDVIDLWQFHEVIYEKDADMIFATDGAIEAAKQAKKEGKVRYVGFTGHKHPRFLKNMLDQDYQWDAAQMPLNVMDAHYRSFQKEIVPICQERGIGILAMKVQGGGILRRANVVTPKEALQYALSLPVSCVVSGMDSPGVLSENIETAAGQSLSRKQAAAILEKVRPMALKGEFELFKSTDMFDSNEGKKMHGKT
jgi:predicted aldo/keto reductase-like oxidoreductase